MNTVFKKHIKILAFLAFGMLSSMSSKADIFDDVARAISGGNAKELARYFNSSIELTVDNTEGMYSKAQAEEIVRNFFSKNAVSSFSITHRGNSGGTGSFATGKYKTASGVTYLVTIYVKEVNGQKYVHELEFEKE